MTTKYTKHTKEKYNSIAFVWFVYFVVKKMHKIYFEESYSIQGAAFDVYREMGCGFLEAVYQECLEHELAMRNISFVSQPAI